MAEELLGSLSEFRCTSSLPAVLSLKNKLWKRERQREEKGKSEEVHQHCHEKQPLVPDKPGAVMAAQDKREVWGKSGTWQKRVLHEDCTTDPQTQGLMEHLVLSHCLFSSYKGRVKGRWKECPCYKNSPAMVNCGEF